MEGLDPDKASIRSRPYDLEKDQMPGSKIRFIGELDQIDEPKSGLPESQRRPPTVLLDYPKELY
jgi:hypothetical protein